MRYDTLIEQWLQKPHKQFARSAQVTSDTITCDCAGFLSLLLEALAIKRPWCLAEPRAMHYFGLLQEIGSSSIASLTAGNVLAWRKQLPPKTGDTGHVLIVMSEPRLVADGLYRLDVVDASKVGLGLSRREIELQCQGQAIIGVRFDLRSKKIKRTSIYHYPIQGGRYCFGCALPVKACNCGVIEPLLTLPNVTVLRHPKERKRTLSTVSLIKQRYPGVLVLDGEQFNLKGFANAALLFPDDDSSDSVKSEQATAPGALLLIDGTWRKAKKILHINPWLLSLPRVSLQPGTTSDYLLRKVKDQQMLSSVEAFAMAVADDSLQGALRPFMEKHIALLGPELYQKNYGHYLNFSD